MMYLAFNTDYINISISEGEDWRLTTKELHQIPSKDCDEGTNLNNNEHSDDLDILFASNYAVPTKI